MKKHSGQIKSLILALTATACAASMSLAQMPQQSQPGQQQPGQQQPNPSNPQVAPLTLESSPPPVNAEEDAAIKAFRDEQDPAKKDPLAETFVQKYPQSRYLPEIYNWQVRLYLSKGEIDKMETTADKELALYPNDPQTLAIVGSTLPRKMDSAMPEEQRQIRLEKAEKFCQKALDLLPTIPKPQGMADEKFQEVKGESFANAYSGLGLVAFRRGKFSDAIPNLENAVKADPLNPDPVNYYVLGIANEKTSHFDDAVTAFTKCAALPSGMKATCTQNIEEAKKLAATQLSMPK